MDLKPNLQKSTRIGYCLFGAALVVGSFTVAPAGWLRIVLPALGVLSIAGGATGI